MWCIKCAKFIGAKWKVVSVEQNMCLGTHVSRHQHKYYLGFNFFFSFLILFLFVKPYDLAPHRLSVILSVKFCTYKTMYSLNKGKTSWHYFRTKINVGIVVGGRDDITVAVDDDVTKGRGYDHMQLLAS